MLSSQYAKTTANEVNAMLDTLKMIARGAMMLANGALAFHAYQEAREGLELALYRTAEDGAGGILSLAVRIGTSDVFGNIATAISLVVMTLALFVVTGRRQ